MPGRDGSGPSGAGPVTGRGLGACNGVNAGFAGRGNGMGRRAGFGGRGLGVAAGLCGVGYRVGRWLYDSAVRANQANMQTPMEQQPVQPPVVPEQDPEKEILQQQTIELQKQVEILTQKLEQLEKTQKSIDTHG